MSRIERATRAMRAARMYKQNRQPTWPPHSQLQSTFAARAGEASGREISLQQAEISVGK
ncbi:hypothetical protein ACKI2N_001880 [Cupriavidus sp. 30B13]|uniref:hypothetical protein n=1 Tax=Cupriavidus sp. 30B13 TaxID=3384241 RepID=UPI003B8FCF3D